MRSVMHHQFSQVPRVEIPRSVFDRSHGFKTTFDEGFLVPFYVDEALPGDTFSLKVAMLCRLATPIVPIMDNMFLDTFFFSVPYRLLWSHFKEMMGEQINPGDSTSYVIPRIEWGGASVSCETLADYFGIPINVTNLNTNALPFRAYNMIYNEWFRDENMCQSLTVPLGDGPDLANNYAVQKRCKRHDYFTSCLPWPQKGTAVQVPLGGTAPIIPGKDILNGHNLGLMFGDGTSSYALSDLAVSNTVQMHQWAQPPDIGDDVSGGAGPVPTGKAIGIGNPSGMVADLSSATAATINSLRQAFQLQRLFERDARGGSRYTEIIRSHFGVISPDMRQQRPEYLGGTSKRIMINPVQQTSSTDNVSPQGNLAAFGILAEEGGGFHHSFTEHSVVMGIMCVRADLTYQQGLNRMWSRRTRYDLYWPALAHLGEQPVLNQEIFADGSGNDGVTFGYQERYAEYRYFPSLITGAFRSTYAQPLDVWHLSQKFAACPVLGPTFINEAPPVSRIVAVQSGPHFLFDSFIELKCARPMPVYSVPGLIDHF